MSHPERPDFISQDPNHGGSCIHNGKQFGWSNCTPTSTAMLVRQATLGKQTPSGCDIRIVTGDWSGGTMLSQCAQAAKSEYGVTMKVYVGSNVIRTSDLHDRISAGSGAVVQGNAIAMVNTPQQSTAGAVNHAVYVNEISGSRALVYDPARSNRISSFGKVTAGPQWWEWELLLEFMASLRPWGDNDPRKLGRGHAYAGIGPDMEPHVHLKFAGSHATSPLPRTFTVQSPVPHQRANVRTGPSNKYPVVRTKPNGGSFVAYQRTDKGQSLAGSSTWWGSHTGTRWMHSSGLKAK